MAELSEPRGQGGDARDVRGAVRPGAVTDIEAIAAVLSQGVDPDGRSIRRSEANSLEENVRCDGVFVFERSDGTIVGCLQFTHPSAGNLRIENLAVSVACRESEVCDALLDALLAARGDERPSVYVVVPPLDHAMLVLLFRRNFVARSLWRDFLEPGVDRFYCQFSNRPQTFVPSERLVLRSAALTQLQALLVSEERVITGLVKAGPSAVFEVDRVERDDPASLRSDEGMSSVAFTAGLLAAITFFLGFAFSSASYPDEVRIMLIGATVSTTAALVIYANAAGELSRIRNNAFAKYMRWGNLLSEYGGAIPLLIVLPVTLAQVARSVSSLVTAVLVSLALLLYTRSEFCVASRYSRTVLLTILDVIVCLSPVLGVTAILYLPVTWPWAAVTGMALILRFLVMLVRDDRERGKGENRVGFE